MEVLLDKFGTFPCFLCISGLINLLFHGYNNFELENL